MACMPCEMLRRTSAYSGGPQREMNGFPAVSNVATPKPIMRFEIKKAGNEAKTPLGQNTKVPVPYTHNPTMNVLLNPYRLKTQPPNVRGARR